MIVFIWTRSGILVPIFFFLSAWLIGYGFNDTTMKNGSYMGFVFLSTSILVLLQSFMIKAMQNAPAEDGSEQAPPQPKRRHTFFYIPVFYWGLLTTTLCIYFFVSGGIGNPKRTSKNSSVYNNTNENSSKKDQEKPKRTINFLNSTMDTLYYYLSDPEGNEQKEKIEPNRFLGVEVEPGEYLIGAFDLNDKLIFSHSDQYIKDESKYKRVKEKDGDVFYYRIISPPTSDETDYDEAWFVMDGQRQLAMIDVTEVCFKGRTEKDITNINWIDHVVEVYESEDLIEPMIGSKNENTYTVLTLGEDIPTRVKSGQHVYTLFSFPEGKKITDKIIEQKVIGRIFE